MISDPKNPFGKGLIKFRAIFLDFSPEKSFTGEHPAPPGRSRRIFDLEVVISDPKNLSEKGLIKVRAIFFIIFRRRALLLDSLVAQVAGHKVS